MKAKKDKSLPAKRRIFIAISATLLVLVLFSLPAFAAMYRYTGTYFKYIGDAFHQKVVDFDGGQAGFQVSGEGTISGSHEVTTVKYEGSPADSVYNISAANLSLYLYGTTAPNAPDNNKVKMISGLSVDIAAKTDVVIGVEMDQGESGYIRQTVSTSSTSDGDYLNINNSFGNTGGTTKRNMEVDGFISDTMHVEGYAEVWETTTVRDGSARSGWWKTLP